jgi:Subtilase family
MNVPVARKFSIESTTAEDSDIHQEVTMNRWFSMLVMASLILAGGRAEAGLGKDKPMVKVNPDLATLYDQYTVYQALHGTGRFQPSNPLLRVVDDRVVIDAVTSGEVRALQADLVALGMEGAVAVGRIVSGQLPISAIAALPALTSLQFARPAYAMTHVGQVTSQGDVAMRSDVARASFGVDGTGVTVGVLSDSFDCLGGAATDVANDDLSPVNVIQEDPGCSSGSDEGRAMLQLIHDVAPGAALAFATAFAGQASFSANIEALAAAGAKVIVDDVIYFAEPMFQDGIIAQAVDTVVAGGSAYFSSAGNHGRQAYESPFRPGNVFALDSIPSAPGAPRFFGGTAHDFDPGAGTDHFQSITVPAGATIIFSFQWDSPFFSVSDAPGSANDLDIYILNAAANQVLAGSSADNVGGDAVELFAFTNTTGATANFNIMLVKFAGSNPGLMKYVRFGGGATTVNEFDTASGTIYGHANAVGAEAVGAAAYFQTPEFGVSPPILEGFSSAGTTPILFTTDGDPTVDPRADKPEIVAPDGTNTTFFGGDIEPDGFPNFFGTSAAAPHAAAVAALMLESNPTLTPASIYARLEGSAIDMGPPGFDNDSGFGLIQADQALLEEEAHDLAVIKITVPKTVTLTAQKPSQTKPVKVQIQNRSPHNETIPDMTTLANLVSLTVDSSGACSDPSRVLQNPGLPKTLKPKKTLNVEFDVTFNCANDPAKGAGHQDYSYTATVNHEALDGNPDTHPEDDSCPRDPLGTVPNPDGKIKDKGCVEVLTDVVDKRTSVVQETP